MRLLSGVRPDVSCLVLKAVEGLVAERAFVGPGQLVGDLGGLASGQRPIRSQNRYRGHVAYFG